MTYQYNFSIEQWTSEYSEQDANNKIILSLYAFSYCFNSVSTPKIAVPSKTVIILHKTNELIYVLTGRKNYEHSKTSPYPYFHGYCKKIKTLFS